MLCAMLLRVPAGTMPFGPCKWLQSNGGGRTLHAQPRECSIIRRQRGGTGSSKECQAVRIAGAISAGQEQVCLLSLKPDIRGAEFPLLVKNRAVFCAKMRRGIRNTLIA